jgi:hypothetical protein
MSDYVSYDFSILFAGINSGELSEQLINLELLAKKLSLASENEMHSFKVQEYTPVLVYLLRDSSLLADIQLLALRCLSNLFETLPPAINLCLQSNSPIKSQLIEYVCDKLMNIEYIDVAEQALLTLNKLSKERPIPILKSGLALSSILQFLQFFPINLQRTGLQTASNLVQSIPRECFDMVIDTVTLLLLIFNGNTDEHSINACLTFFSRLITNIYSAPNYFDKLDTIGVINSLLSSVKSACSQWSSFNSSVVHQIIIMLTMAVKRSATVCETLLKHGAIEAITQINKVYPDELPSIVLLAVELLPDLNAKKYSAINSPAIQPQLPQPGTENINSTDIDEKTDEVEMGQSNPESSREGIEEREPLSSPSEMDSSSNPQDSSPELQNIPIMMSSPNLNSFNSMATHTAKLAIFQSNTNYFDSALHHLLPLFLAGVKNNVSANVRSKALIGMLRIAEYSDSKELHAVLKPSALSSFLVNLLGSHDNNLILAVLQVADVLLKKLDESYIQQFIREGIVETIEHIAINGNDKQLTPSRQNDSPQPKSPYLKAFNAHLSSNLNQLAAQFLSTHFAQYSEINSSMQSIPEFSLRTPTLSFTAAAAHPATPISSRAHLSQSVKNAQSLANDLLTAMDNMKFCLTTQLGSLVINSTGDGEILRILSEIRSCIIEDVDQSGLTVHELLNSNILPALAQFLFNLESNTHYNRLHQEQGFNIDTEYSNFLLQHRHRLFGAVFFGLPVSPFFPEHNAAFHADAVEEQIKQFSAHNSTIGAKLISKLLAVLESIESFNPLLNEIPENSVDSAAKITAAIRLMSLQLKVKVSYLEDNMKQAEYQKDYSEYRSKMLEFNHKRRKQIRHEDEISRTSQARSRYALIHMLDDRQHNFHQSEGIEEGMIEEGIEETEGLSTHRQELLSLLENSATTAPITTRGKHSKLRSDSPPNSAPIATRTRRGSFPSAQIVDEAAESDNSNIPPPHTRKRKVSIPKENEGNLVQNAVEEVNPSAASLQQPSSEADKKKHKAKAASLNLVNGQPIEPPPLPPKLFLAQFQPRLLMLDPFASISTVENYLFELQAIVDLQNQNVAKFSRIDENINDAAGQSLKSTVLDLYEKSKRGRLYFRFKPSASATHEIGFKDREKSLFEYIQAFHAEGIHERSKAGQVDPFLTLAMLQNTYEVEFSFQPFPFESQFEEKSQVNPIHQTVLPQLPEALQKSKLFSRVRDSINNEIAQFNQDAFLQNNSDKNNNTAPQLSRPNSNSLTDSQLSVPILLLLLRSLHQLTNDYASLYFTSDNNELQCKLLGSVKVPQSASFVSDKLSRKLQLQFEDAFAVSSDCFAQWVEPVVSKFFFLFSFESRALMFRCSCFNSAYHLFALQQYLQSNPAYSQALRDNQINRRSRQAAAEEAQIIQAQRSAADSDDSADESTVINTFRIRELNPAYSSQFPSAVAAHMNSMGLSASNSLFTAHLPRLSESEIPLVQPAERIPVIKLLIDRSNVMKAIEELFQQPILATSACIIRAEFANEEGFGSGPTQEFFFLAGREFQKAKLNLWRNDSEKQITCSNVDSWNCWSGDSAWAITAEKGNRKRKGLLHSELSGDKQEKISEELISSAAASPNRSNNVNKRSRRRSVPNIAPRSLRSSDHNNHTPHDISEQAVAKLEAEASIDAAFFQIPSRLQASDPGVTIASSGEYNLPSSAARLAEFSRHCVIICPNCNLVQIPHCERHQQLLTVTDEEGHWNCTGKLHPSSSQSNPVVEEHNSNSRRKSASYAKKKSIPPIKALEVEETCTFSTRNYSGYCANCVKNLGCKEFPAMTLGNQLTAAQYLAAHAKLPKQTENPSEMLPRRLLAASTSLEESCYLVKSFPSELPAVSTVVLYCPHCFCLNFPGTLVYGPSASISAAEHQSLLSILDPVTAAAQARESSDPNYISMLTYYEHGQMRSFDGRILQEASYRNVTRHISYACDMTQLTQQPIIITKTQAVKLFKFRKGSPTMDSSFPAAATPKNNSPAHTSPETVKSSRDKRAKSKNFLATTQEQLLTSNSAESKHSATMLTEQELPPQEEEKLISNNTGLFPSPSIQSMAYYFANPPELKRLISTDKLFENFGKFLAQSVQEQRLLDLPISLPLLKLLMNQPLNVADLALIDSALGLSMGKLYSLGRKYCFVRAINQVNGNNTEDLNNFIGQHHALFSLNGSSISELGIDFTVPGFPNVTLGNIRNGSPDEVKLDNSLHYVTAVCSFLLKDAVAWQIAAIRRGFGSQVNLRGLEYFNPGQLEELICGSISSSNSQLRPYDFSLATLYSAVKIQSGYSKDSRAIQYLFQILSELSAAQQRQFVRFLTGCPRLPQSSLKSLKPALNITRVAARYSDASYHNNNSNQTITEVLPTCMTCQHALKLPDYPSIELMREKLLYAITECQQGFQLS